MSKISPIEQLLAVHLKEKNYRFEQQVRFIPSRRFLADFVIDSDLMVEVQGGVYIRGAHTRGTTYESNCEKMALALGLGYRVLWVTSRQVQNGKAIEWIGKALDRKG